MVTEVLFLIIWGFPVLIAGVLVNFMGAKGNSLLITIPLGGIYFLPFLGVELIRDLGVASPEGASNFTIAWALGGVLGGLYTLAMDLVHWWRGR